MRDKKRIVDKVNYNKKDNGMAKLIRVNGELEVKKADVVVKARYKLNPLALKFITTLITGLKRSDDINEEYIFKVRDFKELTGLKRKDLYWAVKEAVKELLEKPLYIPNDDGFIMCNWISGGHYVENAGEVRFMIYSKLRPYLLEAQEKFLKYRLENILSLRSSYSIRLYEILKDWLELNSRYGNKTEKIISLKELKEILEIPKSYNYGGKGGVKDRILNKSKTELAEHTDILFDYEEIKTGRKVTHLKFIIRPNFKKLQTDNEVQDYNLKSLKHFVSFLRKNYSGNLKAFGYKDVDNKAYWLKMDKDGLVYGFDKKNGNIDFNAVDSEKIYRIWYEIVKENPEYYALLEQGLDFEEIYKNNPDFRLNLIETIERLKEEGII